MNTQNHWIERAQAVMPAGGLGNFDPDIFIRKGNGSRVWDEDGKEYIDYLIGSGPMLLGHGHPEVLDAVHSQLGKGMTFFANNTASVELAEEICRAVPCAEQVRYVTSGGEADMYALRLARAFTGRNRILKFEGGYHGMSAEAQMSLAAIAGNADIMAHFDKALSGDKFLMQLGTLSGNPLAAVAGLKTLEILRQDGSYEKLFNTGTQLMSLLKDKLDKSGHPYHLCGDQTLFDVVFTDIEVVDYRASLTADKNKNARFNQILREHGIFKSPGKLYPSLAINEEDLQITHDAVTKAAADL